MQYGECDVRRRTLICITRTNEPSLAHPISLVMQMSERHLASDRCACVVQREKGGLKEQVDRLQSELRAAQDCTKQLVSSVEQYERENVRLACQAQTAAENADLATADACSSLVRQRGQLELQCRQLKADLAGMDRSDPA